jgi:4-hydroxy-tetrahydrodipicolinate synthase
MSGHMKPKNLTPKQLTPEKSTAKAPTDKAPTAKKPTTKTPTTTKSTAKQTMAGRLAGSFVALITPFNKDGSVDFAAFRDLMAFQAHHGTAAVLIMGSTGETSLLSPEERKRIIVETAKMKSAAMPVFFGCTGNNTEATIANVRFAADNGADGAILAAPAYICAPESDIERFFLDVADATSLPLGIYNNPPRVKSDLHWDHLLRLFRHPNYVVHKESTARVGQVAQVLAARPDVAVMCCDSPNLGLVVPTMSLGGHGTANMTGNVAPAELATISTPWTSFVEADNFKSMYLRLLPLLHFTYSAINPVAVKSLMKALGMPAGNLRKPLTGLEGEALAKGLHIVEELGLATRYGYKLKPLSAVAA